MESDSIRDSYLKSRNGVYNPHSGYGEVVLPTKYFWLGTIFTAAGVCVVLAAVCSAMASSVTHDDWSFKAVTVVLVFSAVVGCLLFLFCVLLRKEEPTPQAEFVQYNNNAMNAPVAPSAAAAP